MRNMELQPVILAAGQGSRIRDLTSKIPKALLPVANQPLILYPIQMLERAGFQDAIVVVLEHQKADIQRVTTDSTLHLDFVTISASDDLGTADTLRHIKDKVKTDVLLLSCDVISDLSLHLLADVHRTYDSTVTMLMAPLPDLTEVAVPGGKANKKLEKDFVGLDEKGNRVLYLTSAADIEESITFDKALLKRHPRVCVQSRLMDCHVYILKKWVIDFLTQKENITTVKGELIPYLVKKQFGKSKNDDATKTNQTFEGTNESDIYSLASEETLTQAARKMSSWIDHHGDMEECFHGDKIRCYAYVMDGGFCLRANTLGLYCEANRQVPRQMSSIFPQCEIPLVHPNSSVSTKTQIGADSIVGEGSTVGERVGVKKSVIGKNCNIADKVKLANCIIMDNVTIKEGSVLSGCVVSEKITVGERCELKDCLVGQNINDMSKISNEMIVEMDRMMEI